MAGYPNLMYPTVPDNRHAGYISTRPGIDTGLIPQYSRTASDARWMRQVADDAMHANVTFNVKMAQARFMNADNEYQNFLNDKTNELNNLEGQEFFDRLPEIRDSIRQKRDELLAKVREDKPAVYQAFEKASDSHNVSWDNKTNALAMYRVHQWKGSELNARMQIAAENVLENFHKTPKVRDMYMDKFNACIDDLADYAGIKKYANGDNEGGELSAQYVQLKRKLTDSLGRQIVEGVFMSSEDYSGALNFLRSHQDWFSYGSYSSMMRRSRKGIEVQRAMATVQNIRDAMHTDIDTLQGNIASNYAQSKPIQQEYNLNDGSADGIQPVTMAKTPSNKPKIPSDSNGADAVGMGSMAVTDQPNTQVQAGGMEASFIMNSSGAIIGTQESGALPARDQARLDNLYDKMQKDKADRENLIGEREYLQQNAVSITETVHAIGKITEINREIQKLEREISEINAEINMITHASEKTGNASG